LSRGDRSRPEHERTAEERERDREERAQRRARRADATPEPLSGAQPGAVVAPAFSEALAPEPAAESAPPEPPVTAAPPEAPLLEGEPPPVEDAALVAPAPPPLEDPVAVAPEQDARVAEPLEGELAPAAADGFRGTPPAPGRRAASGRPPRARRSFRARLAALVALLAAVAAVFFVARALLDTGHHKSIAAPKVIKLLIPEGRTRAQIAERASAAGLKGSYKVASRRSPLLDPVHYGAPRGTADLEGFLFPATYNVNPGEAASRLVQEQLIAFRENFGAGDVARARALHVTPYQMLTIASMIEREAQVPGDRAKIAAVIYNRLKLGIPLGIDATIYYAVEQQKGIATYTRELTEAQLHINSRYNTRIHTGLPPTPISNPGTASIRAAAHPSGASYLYYVAGADGCGEQVFSTTLAAFEANAAAYKAAVAHNGGRPPRCKHG
jgi:cell division protein YceG involved in septum cleavage